MNETCRPPPALLQKQTGNKHRFKMQFSHSCCPFNSVTQRISLMPANYCYGSQMPVITINMRYSAVYSTSSIHCQTRRKITNSENEPRRLLEEATFSAMQFLRRMFVWRVFFHFDSKWNACLLRQQQTTDILWKQPNRKKKNRHFYGEF